jgi:hypothetical protein
VASSLCWNHTVGFFFSIGGWTQGLMLPTQVLYYLRVTPPALKLYCIQVCLRQIVYYIYHGGRASSWNSVGLFVWWTSCMTWTGSLPWVLFFPSQVRETPLSCRTVVERAYVTWNVVGCWIDYSFYKLTENVNNSFLLPYSLPHKKRNKSNLRTSLDLIKIVFFFFLLKILFSMRYRAPFFVSLSS